MGDHRCNFCTPEQDIIHQGEIAAALEHLELDFRNAAADLSFGPIDMRTACSALRTPILWQAGRPDEAMEQAANAVVVAESGAHPFNLVLSLQAEAVVQHCCGNRERGLAAAVRLGVAAAEQGIDEVKAMAWTLEASLRSQTEAEDRVVALGDAGVEACRRHGTVLTHAYVLAISAEDLVNVRRFSQAAALLDEAQEQITMGAARFWEPELHRLRGELHCLSGGRGWWAAAEESFRTALDIAGQQGSRSLVLRAAISMLRPLRQQKRHDEAARILDTSLAGVEGGEATRDVRQGRELLQRLR